MDRERARLDKERTQLTGRLAGVRAKLENENFTGRAPAEVVERERENERSLTLTLEKLERQIAALEG